MLNFRISEATDEYDRLVPFFIENELEFDDEGPIPTPTDIIKCWKITEGTGEIPEGPAEDGIIGEYGRIIGGFVLAKRDGEFIVDGIAIDPEYRKLKLGKELLNRGIEETLRLGGRRIFLVARAPEFFRKQGFGAVEREDAPEFFECLTCPQYGKQCHPEVMRLDL